MIEECFKINSILGVSLEEVDQKIGELRRGAGWNSWSQPCILLVKLFQSLGSLSLDSIVI